MKKLTNHELVKKIEQHVKNWLKTHLELGYNCKRDGDSIKLVIGNCGHAVRMRGGRRPLNETQKTEIERLIAQITETFKVFIEKCEDIGTQLVCSLCLPKEKASS